MIRRAVVRWEYLSRMVAAAALPRPEAPAGSSWTLQIASARATGSPARDDPSVDSVLHDLRNPANGSNEYRQPRGHRRQKRNGKTFPQGREGEYIHRPEQLGKVATRSKEEDGIPDTLPHGLLTEPILLPPAPDDCQGHLLSLPAQPPGRFDQVFLPLLLFETPHGSDEEPVPWANRAFPWPLPATTCCRTSPHPHHRGPRGFSPAGPRRILRCRRGSPPIPRGWRRFDGQAIG